MREFVVERVRVGLIYCNGCEPEVSELPILKKRPQTVKRGQRPATEGYSFDACAASVDDLQGRGGAA
jgi:hypothetical protein